MKTNTRETQSWIDERVDALAALVTVTDEQLADRERAEHGLATDTPRVRELVHLVFDDDTPSVESYLEARGNELVAA